MFGDYLKVRRTVRKREVMKMRRLLEELDLPIEKKTAVYQQLKKTLEAYSR